MTADEHRSIDPAAIIGGIQHLLGWAGQTIVGPHAGHVDPVDHPECMVCRGVAAIRLLGLDSLGGPADWDLDATSDSRTDTNVDVTGDVTFVGDDDDVRWIPVVRGDL